MSKLSTIVLVNNIILPLSSEIQRKVAKYLKPSAGSTVSCSIVRILSFSDFKKLLPFDSETNLPYREYRNISKDILVDLTFPINCTILYII